MIDSEFNFTLLITILAFTFLIVLLIIYLKDKDGIRKGSIIIAIVGITLVLFPFVQNMEINLLEGSVSYSKEEKEQKKIQYKELNQFINKQVDSFNNKIELINKRMILQNKTLQDLISQKDNIKIKEKLTKLIQPIKTFSSYEITLQKLKFNHICEKVNKTGEFFYTFMINGDSIASIDVDEAKFYKAEKGDVLDLSNYKKVIKTVKENDDFNFNGTLNEYDGKTFFRNAIKVTNVGQVYKNYPLKETKDIKIEFGSKDNTVCQATLTMSINKVKN